MVELLPVDSIFSEPFEPLSDRGNSRDVVGCCDKRNGKIRCDVDNMAQFHHIIDPGMQAFVDNLLCNQYVGGTL